MKVYPTIINRKFDSNKELSKIMERKNIPEIVNEWDGY